MAELKDKTDWEKYRQQQAGGFQWNDLTSQPHLTQIIQQLLQLMQQNDQINPRQGGGNNRMHNQGGNRRPYNNNRGQNQGGYQNQNQQPGGQQMPGQPIAPRPPMTQQPAMPQQPGVQQQMGQRPGPPAAAGPAGNYQA